MRQALSELAGWAFADLDAEKNGQKAPSDTNFIPDRRYDSKSAVAIHNTLAGLSLTDTQAWPIWLSR